MSQEQGQRYVNAFRAWAATMSDDDFRQMIFAPKGILNRQQIKKLSGLSDQAIKKNATVKEELKQLEDGLRARGVLPPLTKTAQARQPEPKRYDPSISRKALESRRLSALEQENIELKARVATLQAKLKRYGELSEVLTEFGVAPDA
ncbi:MAG: VPA1267 family protein [Pseudomonadaceae bacterium]